MSKFKPHIIPEYPKHNTSIFEEWFGRNYQGANTDRELLPVYFTSYYVNNNYGNDQKARKELRDFLYSLDKDKKYFSVVQYDDSILDDVTHLDILRFEMSKTFGIGLPLLCMPHPYSFSTPKKYLVSFVGSRTHPIRDELEQFKDKEGWYISYEPHDNQDYCRVMHESLFTLCPRGYGANSFRICEALQYNSIPVYISDEFVEPFGVDFNEIGLKVKREEIPMLPAILNNLNPFKRYDELKESYDKYYTYEGCMKQIINSIETEFNNREEKEEATTTT